MAFWSVLKFSNNFLFILQNKTIKKKRPYSEIEAVQVAVSVADGSLKLQLPRQKMIPQLYDICSKCLEYEKNETQKREKKKTKLKL